MAQPGGQRKDHSSALPPEPGSSEVRIDSPHELSSAEAHVRPKRSRRRSRAPAEVPTGVSSQPDPESTVPASTAEVAATSPAPQPGYPPLSDDPEALAVQIRQLLRHLAARRRWLIRRQRKLALRREKIAAQIRTAQLAFEQRELALTERHRQLDQWQERLAAREQAIAEREQSLAKEEARLAERACQLAQAAEALKAEKQQLEEHLRRQQDELYRQITQRAEELEQQHRQWQQRYELQVAELRQAREALDRQREQFENQLAFERQKLEAEQARIVEIHRLLRAQVDKYLESTEAQLAKRRAQLKTLAAELTHRQTQLLRRQEELLAREKKLAEKGAELEALRCELAEALAQAEKLRGELHFKYRLLVDEWEHEQLRIKQEWAGQLAHIREIVERLLVRQQELARREATLADFQSELEAGYARLFRERLLVEELCRRWISEAATTASGQDQVGRLQKFIRETAAQVSRPDEAEATYRKIRDDLARLEGLQDRLRAEAEELSRRRQELEAWSLARANQLAEAAHVLAVRCRELTAREEALADLTQQWELEKAILRQEIFRLRLQLMAAGGGSCLSPVDTPPPTYGDNSQENLVSPADV